MKTITLQDFHAEVKKLAAKKGKTVSVAKVELSQYSSGMQIEFQCYVDGYSFHSGETPAEALSKLRASMFPVKRAIPVVEIEI